MLNMPGRNVNKPYLDDSYYHVYNRGVNKEAIFREKADYVVFLNLLKRYLSDEAVKDQKGRPYPNFSGELDLLAFCLMPNHFHLLIYQSDKSAMQKLLQHVTTAYGMYFNKKYARVGPILQNRYRAVLIMHDAYLEHISRYIHLNPHDYKAWEFSSLPYYAGQWHADWIHPQRILDIFDSDPGEYLRFVADYTDYKQQLDIIKHELADTLV